MQKKKKHFLSEETYEAIVKTTKCTIAKIEHLLETGFQFVLTRKFNSDNLERKFSALRQANGGNYIMNARAAIFGVEKLLRTGYHLFCYELQCCVKDGKTRHRERDINP
jgi:hypothetical protein